MFLRLPLTLVQQGLELSIDIDGKLVEQVRALKKKPYSEILHTFSQSALKNIPQACSSLGKFNVGNSLEVPFWKYFVTRFDEGDPPVSSKLFSQGSSIAQAFLKYTVNYTFPRNCGCV